MPKKFCEFPHSLKKLFLRIKVFISALKSPLFCIHLLHGGHFQVHIRLAAAATVVDVLLLFSIVCIMWYLLFYWWKYFFRVKSIFYENPFLGHDGCSLSHDWAGEKILFTPAVVVSRVHKCIFLHPIRSYVTFYCAHMVHNKRYYDITSMDDVVYYSM